MSAAFVKMLVYFFGNPFQYFAFLFGFYDLPFCIGVRAELVFLTEIIGKAVIVGINAHT